MTDWKELGEVPDSEEDDDFDSQDLDSGLPPPVTTAQTRVLDEAAQITTVHERQPEDNDVWDIPDSPRSQPPTTPPREPEHERPTTSSRSTHELPDSSPLSSARSDRDLPSIGDIVARHWALGRSNSSFPGNIGERGSVESTSPIPELPGDGDTPQSLAVLHEERQSAPQQSQVLGHDSDILEARQAAVRYERSLRPRKPIQQHPYLLENAQYSSVLKRHGIQPVRAIIEAAREQRRRETTTQDDEFEEESQVSLPLGIVEESQATDLRSFPDFGSLELPSSSPPKTSPLNNRAGASSQASSQNDTDNTSLAGQDLPTLKDLLSRSSGVKNRVSKRTESTPQSAARKRRRRDVVDSDPVESQDRARTRILESPDPLLASFPSSQPSLNPVFENHAAQVYSSPPRTLAQTREQVNHENAAHPLLTGNESDAGVIHGQKGDQTDDASSGSESDVQRSGEEIVNTVGRRIRGVLPASWLRLDQKSDHGKAQKDARKQHGNHSPGREQRRGVAQRRQALPGSTINQFMFEDSDDELVPLQDTTTDDTFHNQTRLVLQPMLDVASSLSLSSDDDGSVVEESTIDRMLPGRKRQLKLSDSFGAEFKRLKTGDNTGRHTTRMPKQPKITTHFDNSGQAASGDRPPKRRRATSKRPRKQSNASAPRSRNAVRRTPPPRLSILDVIEPNAPQFLKIAARTARRQPNQGRSSPRRKIIKLATRRDHVDAMSVLSDWREGSIRPRASVSAAKKVPTQAQHTRPLTETSGNSLVNPRSVSRPSGTPRKLVKHVSDGGTTRFVSDGRSPRKQVTAAHGSKARQGQALSTRPAQLETDGANQPSRFAFHASKRLLDRLYHKKNEGLSVASSVGALETSVDDQHRASPSPEVQTGLLQESTVTREKRPRLRFHKRTRPQRINLEAPEYSHADDPLPVQYPAISKPSYAEPNGSKLLGLGPYGTHYTHHFEVFPLDHRVYFHDSTLLGSGAVDAATSSGYCEKLSESRPRVSFSLGDRILRWGPWDSQTSSELGVLVDSVADQLEASLREGKPPDASTILSAITFLLNYVQKSLSFMNGDGTKSFVARVHEALHGFNQRLSPHIQQLVSDQGIRYELMLRMYDRLLLVILLAWRTCQNDSLLMGEQFQFEELLKCTAKTAIQTLLSAGLNEVQKTYDDLSQLRFRERGLRDERPAIHSWVIVMKVLDFVSIPRASFWDTLHAVMLTPKDISSTDVQVFEKMWQNMFTLLPLVEFNNTGVVISGHRHGEVSDGWALPQKLLKRVFQLYQENTHQASSFNTYCRALVGRCHYLVQQWGWRKSVTVIGVIFDFFGSQNLEHLRNEEVYKSPRFLEELAGCPTLEIEPEDRCFHVFLKLIALSIRKLKEVGSINDIRNLVARTMPNHNRHHLKEQKIHERDLAALRNHHDLLVTLFWAAPSDLRPVASRIETLVVPASSHKEACLINLRAWNQLARFVVTSGEVAREFKPFGQWRNRFFEQMMQQYDSVASDIQQQLTSLPKDDRQSINPDLINTMVTMNKAAVMDVLHLSVTASLDVMKHAPSLEAATFALNTPQLQLVFKHFAAAPPELDWTILRASLATLDSFLCQLEEFQDNQESQQSESQLLDAAQADDSFLVLDQNVANSFFSMARCVLSARASRDTSAGGIVSKNSCMEQAVILSARMGMRFINGGLVKLSDMFKYGKHGLFDGPPHKMSLDQRKFLVLFISTLLKHGFDDFHDVDFTLTEVWALSLVKPREFLGYENQLAVQLKRHNSKYVPEAVVGLSIGPDYNSNRDLFEFAVSTMRRSIAEAGPSMRKILMSQHSKTLRLVMEQIKGDLRSLTHDAVGHHNFVVFVRDIISLIRSHGPENCAVDDFFYQITREYSPSVQDPQLQVASMVSYGLRLREGDNRATHQLFYFLVNNFKLSMNNNKLEDEAKMLRKGMDNQGILEFVVGGIFPAIIRAACVDDSAAPLLDVYVEAFRQFLSEDIASPELSEDQLMQLVVLLKAILIGMQRMRHEAQSLSTATTHVIRQLMTVVNLIWPSLQAMSLSGVSGLSWTQTKTHMGQFKEFAVVADVYLTGLLNTGRSHILPSRLFDGVKELDAEQLRLNAHVTGFADSILDDIRKNWLITQGTVMIQAPAKARSTQSTQTGQGVKRAVWDADNEMRGLHEAIREWRDWWREVFDSSSVDKYAVNVVF